MSDEVDFLKCVYDRLNARDMENVLAAMHEDVIWANGMEGGHVHGRDEVRSYWTRQWRMIDPHVEPVAFAQAADRRRWSTRVKLPQQRRSRRFERTMPPYSEIEKENSWCRRR